MIELEAIAEVEIAREAMRALKLVEGMAVLKARMPTRAEEAILMFDIRQVRDIN